MDKFDFEMWDRLNRSRDGSNKAQNSKVEVLDLDKQIISRIEHELKVYHSEILNIYQCFAEISFFKP